MKPKATIQWTLAFLLLASCMQAQSIWNTAHLANVKHSIHEPFYATTYETLKRSGQAIGLSSPFCHDERKKHLPAVTSMTI